MTTFISQWLKYLEIDRQLSEHSIRAYKADVLSFNQFMEQCEVALDAANRNPIRGWLAKQINAGK